MRSPTSLIRPARASSPRLRRAATSALSATSGTARLRRRAWWFAMPWLSLASVALLEELLSRSGVLNAARFPPADAVLLALADEVTSGRVFTPLRETTVDWLISLALSFGLALALAVVLNLSARVRDYSAPVIAFLRPMPCTALIPLVIVSLGANAQGLIFLTTFGALWQMLPVMSHAMGKLDEVARDTARVFGFDAWQRFRWVTLRALQPHLLSSLRIGATASLVLLIGMELLTGASGIGRLIAFTYAGSNLTLMYAYVMLSGLLGVAVNLLLSRVVARHAARVGGRAR